LLSWEINWIDAKLEDLRVTGTLKGSNFRLEFRMVRCRLGQRCGELKDLNSVDIFFTKCVVALSEKKYQANIRE